MKNKKLGIITLFVAVAGIITGLFFAQDTYYAAPNWKSVEESIAAAYDILGEDAAFTGVKDYMPPSDIVQDLVNRGVFPNHVDQLKALGYTDVDYSAVTGNSTGSSNNKPSDATATSSTPTPASFTVEDMEDTPMWATQTVNYRDGASTDYNKLGSLEKYEQVIVNGVASTGWYRFNTEDGTAAYVSNNYLTTEDPSNRELNIYNEETDQVDTFIFEDTAPEVIDEVIEDVKEEYAEKEPVVEEPEPKTEETVEPEPVVEEPPVEVEEESSVHSWQFYAAIIFAVVCVVVIGISVFFIVRNKKRGRVD